MPPSPEVRFRRLLKIARVDGISLLALAGAAAVGAAIGGEWSTAGIGLGVVACGWLELHGRRLAQRGANGSVAALCSAQLLCLVLILLYACLLTSRADADHILQLLPAFTRAQLAELFPDPGEVEQLLLGLQRLVAAAIAIAALLYQGGMAFYYLRARSVIKAVHEMPPVIGS